MSDRWKKMEGPRDKKLITYEKGGVKEENYRKTEADMKDSDAEVPYFKRGTGTSSNKV